MSFLTSRTQQFTPGHRRVGGAAQGVHPGAEAAAADSLAVQQSAASQLASHRPQRRGKLLSGSWLAVLSTCAVFSMPLAAQAATYSVGWNLTTQQPFPRVLQITEGDSVKFSGAYDAAAAKFYSRQAWDLVARISNPTGLSNAEMCGLTGNGADHFYDAQDANEFTGPNNYAASGIFVLGPEGPDKGYYETTNAECSTIATQPNELMGEFEKVVNPTTGTTYRLCAPYYDKNKNGVFDDRDKRSKHGNAYTLESTWNNIDVRGVVVRINWSELQVKRLAVDGSYHIEFDWTRLDHELDQAALRGKFVLLEVLAGSGTPEWVFTTETDTVYGPPGTGQVTPVQTKDYGTDGDRPDGCGYSNAMGSPSDAHYRELVQYLIREVTLHIRQDSRWMASLASFKVSFANFLTGEMRLPKRCLDTSVAGNSDCVCNTQLWAQAGYRPSALYEFINMVEYELYTGLQAKKSLIYMLIQDGFPLVSEIGDYFSDATKTNPPPNLPGPFEQTQVALDMGQQGLFVNPTATSADVSKDPSKEVLDRGKLFVVMHAGLQSLPNDVTVGTSCPQGQDLVPHFYDNKYEAVVSTSDAPGPLDNDLGDGHCPNRWAVNEALEGQLQGAQTTNAESVNTLGDLNSALWNATINSNTVFVEIYERLAWQNLRTNGSGPLAAPLSTTGTYSADGPQYQKNLWRWGLELTHRRWTLALRNPGNPYAADPSPTFYTFAFNKDLAPGATETYYFTYPGRCTAWGTDQYGAITVTGK